MAQHSGAHLQYVMDIDPRSHWHPRELVAQFGGYHPPGLQRELVFPFPGDRVRADLLLLLLREITVRQIPGAIAELGVHRGDSARLLHHYCPERRLYLFDTYTGFREEDLQAESIKTAYNQSPAFQDTDVATVMRIVGPLSENVIPVVGWFPESATPEVAAEQFALVHLDADLEAPIAAGLDYFWPRVSPGGYVVVHDYNAWPGARLAVDKFRAAQSVHAVPMPDKSGSIVLAK